MNTKERALAGAVSRFLATFVLSGLRVSLDRVNWIHTTAPEQVIRRIEELGLLDGWPPHARRALTVGAHFGYGSTVGAVFGLLRNERGKPENEEIAKLRGTREDSVSEAAVGATLGVLSWGAGWAGWLPLVGVHQPHPGRKRHQGALARARPRGLRCRLGHRLPNAIPEARMRACAARKSANQFLASIRPRTPSASVRAAMKGGT